MTRGLNLKYAHDFGDKTGLTCFMWLHYDQTSDYAEAERAARSACRGLWAADRPINPHDWRKGDVVSSPNRPNGGGKCVLI